MGLTSAMCGAGPCQNHHIVTGGAGRKADARFIVPLCQACHLRIHRIGRPAFEMEWGVSLELCAAVIEENWQVFRRVLSPE